MRKLTLSAAQALPESTRGKGLSGGGTGDATVNVDYNQLDTRYLTKPANIEVFFTDTSRDLSGTICVLTSVGWAGSSGVTSECTIDFVSPGQWRISANSKDGTVSVLCGAVCF